MRPLLGRIPGGLLRRPALLVIPLLVLALYCSSVDLPFFWDDAANFNWMHARPLRSIWVDATGFPYYRPLGFSLWRALQAAFGPTAVVPFHIANLAMHAANALLVGGLAARFVVEKGAGGPASGRSLASLTAGAFTAVFPFAALAVSHTAQAFHLLVTGLALTAVACALRYRDAGGIGWGFLALVAAVLAPFAHENGVTTGGLILLAVLAAPPSPPLDASAGPNAKPPTASRRAALICVAAILANLAFLPWWAIVPKTRPESFAWVGWESLAQSTVFFLEGLTFPFQIPARWLMETFGWSDMAAVSVLGLLALGLATSVLFGSSRLRRALALSLGYWLLAAAPSLLALPFSYIVVSPRLQVFPSPAAAFLWGLVILQTAQRISRRFVAANLAIVQIGLAAVVALAPAAHIARTVRLHVSALSPIHALAQAVREAPSHKQLVINAPNWVAPVRADYALGHEGVEIMPDYVPPQLLAWTNTGIRAPLDGVAFPNVFPKLRKIYFSAWGPAEDWTTLAARLPEYERVWIWRYSDDLLSLQEAGSTHLGAVDRPKSYVASFDGRVWLLTVRADLDGNQVRLDLWWRSTGRAVEDVFAHVLDCDGQVLGQRDGAALGGVYPLWLWPAGVLVHDVRHIRLEETPRSGCYRLEIGLFDPADGTRTPAYASGGRLANDSFVLER